MLVVPIPLAGDAGDWCVIPPMLMHGRVFGAVRIMGGGPAQSRAWQKGWVSTMVFNGGLVSRWGGMPICWWCLWQLSTVDGIVPSAQLYVQVESRSVLFVSPDAVREGGTF